MSTVKPENDGNDEVRRPAYDARQKMRENKLQFINSHLKFRSVGIMLQEFCRSALQSFSSLEAKYYTMLQVRLNPYLRAGSNWNNVRGKYADLRKSVQAVLRVKNAPNGLCRIPDKNVDESVIQYVGRVCNVLEDTLRAWKEEMSPRTARAAKRVEKKMFEDFAALPTPQIERANTELANKLFSLIKAHQILGKIILELEISFVSSENCYPITEGYRMLRKIVSSLLTRPDYMWVKAQTDYDF